MERVVDDVVDGRLVLLVRLDQPRPVAAAEDVVLSLVALVEGSGVAAVQVSHAVCEVRERSLDEQVVVIPHQAADVGAPAVAAFDPAQDVEEDDPVAVVQHDRRVIVAPDPDVVVGAGGEVAVGPTHLPNLASGEPPGSGCHAFGPRPARSCHVPGTRPGMKGRVRGAALLGRN